MLSLTPRLLLPDLFRLSDQSALRLLDVMHFTLQRLSRSSTSCRISLSQSQQRLLQTAMSRLESRTRSPSSSRSRHTSSDLRCRSLNNPVAEGLHRPVVGCQILSDFVRVIVENGNGISQDVPDHSFRAWRLCERAVEAEKTAHVASRSQTFLNALEADGRLKLVVPEDRFLKDLRDLIHKERAGSSAFEHGRDHHILGSRSHVPKLNFNIKLLPVYGVFAGGMNLNLLQRVHGSSFLHLQGGLLLVFEVKLVTVVGFFLLVH
mmetsp:Transcript_13248/g.30464  ORF Transcript_13248/g.30464 Transcript_13248/m.30464 type:complete len:263 (-) Transcript_13248:377-1165(-)